MSRRTVEEITDDVTGMKFYATDDGATTVPFTYTNAGGESVNLDVSPDTKAALYALLSGDRQPMANLLSSLQPKPARGAIMSTEKRNDVSAWWASTHREKYPEGTFPGRVTSQMEEAYDIHIKARDAKIAADTKLAEVKPAEEKPATPQSRQSRRNAA